MTILNETYSVANGVEIPKLGLGTSAVLCWRPGPLDSAQGLRPCSPSSTDITLAGSRRREVGVDAWAIEQLAPWLRDRAELPVGPLFCVIDGPTRGRGWSAPAVRSELRRAAAQAGARRRPAPHQLRHAHAVELGGERVPLPIIQRQLGHRYLSTTGAYLEGISVDEIVSTIGARRAPMMHASAGLEL